MAVVTICNDSGAQENKVLSMFAFFPHLFATKWSVVVKFHKVTVNTELANTEEPFLSGEIQK